MNKKLFNLLLVIFSILFTMSCSYDNNLSIDENEPGFNGTSSEFEYIKYGTSFGECYGYCLRKVTVSDSKVVFEKKSWNLQDFPIITITESYDEDSWEKLTEKIDYAEFLNIAPVIGCPDCADGGAEWVEIKKKDTTYKVTFEYGNEPAVIKEYIQDLRTLLASYND